jgi:hypothetical protein
MYHVLQLSKVHNAPTGPYHYAINPNSPYHCSVCLLVLCLNLEVCTNVGTRVSRLSQHISSLIMPGIAPHKYIPPSGVKPMRVFLVQTAKGLMSSSGGYKANICLLRHLASRGHIVRQLCYSYRGEIEDYVQKIAKRSACHLQVRRRRLHLSKEDGTLGIDVRVEELTMDDGIQIVSLESEAFEAAFGGKDHIHNALATETADYIEVTQASRVLHSPRCMSISSLTLALTRLESCLCVYPVLFRSCRTRSNISHQRTSFATMASLCKPPPPWQCPISECAELALYILPNNCRSGLSLVECQVK